MRLEGPPCGPYAQPGKGQFLSGQRAGHLLGIDAVACAFEPETIDIGSLYGIAGDGGARALTNTDEVMTVMNAADYHRLVPSGVAGVECVCAASIGSAVFRNRVLLHCEQKNLALSELGLFGLQLDGGATAGSLASHLASKEETPPDSFAGGTIVRLDEPCHIGAPDAHSPTVVGHVIAGDAGERALRRLARSEQGPHRGLRAEGAGKTEAQKRPRSGPSDGGRRDAETKRRRSDDRTPEGGTAPSQTRAGRVGIPPQELPVGEKVPPEEPQGELSRQEHA